MTTKESEWVEVTGTLYTRGGEVVIVTKNGGPPMVVVGEIERDVTLKLRRPLQAPDGY